MKAIKLCFEDPCLFGTELTHERCDFLKKNMDFFMSMYKAQGSTFWLRFIVSFRCYIEQKITDSRKPLRGMLQFFKSFHYIYINIHKKFVEGSNTSVKKFVGNLHVLGKNSPQLLGFQPRKWLFFLGSSQHLQNVMHNLLGLPDKAEINEFTVLIYTVYSDFFASLCSVFELWYFSCDLTELESKTVDSKIIYWLPPIEFKTKNMKPMCFDKYISDYWKGELQRMLMIEGINEYFSSHRKFNCCDMFAREKNLFYIFMFNAQDALSVLKVLRDEESEEDDNKGKIETVTEIILKEVCILQPKAEMCKQKTHKKCYMKICHDVTCAEPYVCMGSQPCVITCDINLQKLKDKEKRPYRGINMSIELFPVKKNKRDVCTEAAEPFLRNIETYVHLPSEMAKYSYIQCLSELYNFDDEDPRKAECVNRLRKKLRDKQQLGLVPACKEDFKDKVFRTNLMEMADFEMRDIEVNYCVSKEEHFVECHSFCDCFLQLVTSKCNDSADAFGRVVFFEKTTLTIPTHCCLDKLHKNNSNLDSKCCSNTESKAKPGSNDKKLDIKDSSNADSKNINSNADSKNINSNADSKNINSKGDSKNINSNVDSKNINSNVDSKNINSTANSKNNNLKTDSKNSSKADFKTSSKVDSKCNSKLDSKNSFIPDSKSNSNPGLDSSKPDSKGTTTKGINTDSKSNANASSASTFPVFENVKNIKHSNKMESNNLTSNVVKEVDEILKFIGINDNNIDVGNAAAVNEEISKKVNPNKDSKSNEDKAVENFFNLIGVKDTSESTESSSKELKLGDKSDNKGKLRVCAFCGKKETQRKTFKRCSKCKEENFPVHRYYCSRECLIEDWTESHQVEHLRKQKMSS